jgi:serine/threonine-protein kinase
VLFELLCGRRPFEAQGLAALIRQHVAEPPPRPRDLQPGLPAAIEAVLLRALEKDPDRRFASAAEMAEALASAASVPAETVP